MSDKLTQAPGDRPPEVRTAVLLHALARLIHIWRDEGLAGIRYRIFLLRKNPELIQNRWKKLGFLTHGFSRFAAWQARAGAKRHAARKQRSAGGIHFRLECAPPLFAILRQEMIISGWAVNLKAPSPVAVRAIIGGTVYHAAVCERLDVRRDLASVAPVPSAMGFRIAPAHGRTGLQQVVLQIQAADASWITIHRSFVWRRAASLRRYNDWLAREQQLLHAQTSEMQAHIGIMINKPAFTVLVTPGSRPALLQATLDSIRRQIYPHCESRVITPGGAVSQEGIGEFIVPMAAGQLLAPTTLYEFACELNRAPDTDIVYADEDSIGENPSRHSPFYKPGWSPDYLECFNYIGFPACIRTGLIRECLGGHAYDCILRATEKTKAISHIEKILGSTFTGKPNDTAADIAALEGRLARTGRKGHVRENTTHKGCYEILAERKHSPLVSIVIPTAGKTVTAAQRRIDLITNIVGQIRSESTYKNIEIIVVDNGDLTPEQVRMLADGGCIRLTYRKPGINIPDKLSMGANAAKGEMLILMNDDIEILTPSWIEHMLAHFEKPHVGVVGAKLLYPNGLIQHAGVVQCAGSPDHVRRFFPAADAGYFFSSCGVRNYMAVTGACMMTPAALYREVGGYSPELAVCFNDIDYCLKLRSKGCTVVYAPDVELTHMEAMSRVATLIPDEVAWYEQRWAGAYDPFYNEEFLTATPPGFLPRLIR